MEWKEVRLGDVCEIYGRIGFRGYTTNDLVDTPKEGAISLSPKNIINGELNLDKCTYIKWDKYYESPEIMINPNEIIITKTGSSVGRTTFVRRVVHPMTLNPQLVVLKNISENAEFLSYYIKSALFQSVLKSIVVGSAIPTLSQKNLANLIINVPKEVAYQRRIASILSSLDRKIELNNKINADLEEMAQAIFKNWFVDFEPFKDGKFVDSELGMIPEGWKVVVFDNILKVTTTKTGKEGIPEYSVTNTGIHPRDEKFTKNLSKSSAKNKLIRKGNLVFGMSREILNWGIMKEEIGGVSSAYNVYIVDEKIVSTTYLEYFIAQRMDYFADLIKPASREGQGVDKALLMKKIICIPPSEVLDVFLEKYNSIMHLTEIRNQENSRLSLLRDTLLPRLMSGELEVPE